MIEETLDIVSDGLRLEGRLVYAATTRGHAAVLLCPPHPFLGGDMDNNVVRALVDELAACGMIVLRFNYRGIGGSEVARDLHADQAAFWRDSTCPDYEAEIHRDCAAACATLRRACPGVPLYLVGYSFGCLPALALSRTLPVARLLLVAPPLAKWTVTETDVNVDERSALYYAPGDFACPEDLARALFARLPRAHELRSFVDADHFFVGREHELARAAAGFLDAA
ncbi:MAG: alpha/beta fold hydrolase [Gammaproteobacteria bacterium]